MELITLQCLLEGMHTKKSYKEILNMNSTKHRKVNMVLVTERRFFSVANMNESKEFKYSIDHISKNEVDNHANTCCAGRNFRPTFITNQVYEVLIYHKDYVSKKNVPMVSAATAWDNPKTGETIILHVHQALWFGLSLQKTLLSSNQIR